MEQNRDGEVKDSIWYENHVEAALREGNVLQKEMALLTGFMPINQQRMVNCIERNYQCGLESYRELGQFPQKELWIESTAICGIGNKYSHRHASKKITLAWVIGADVLCDLPKRINSWLKRLTSEGVYGADAIFACIGPAMELYSKWDRVEKADGTIVTIDDYLKIVWDTVAIEAIKIIDPESNNKDLEDDARFSMVVLWTLRQSLEPIDNRGFEEKNGDAKEQNQPHLIFLLIQQVYWPEVLGRASIN